MEGATDPTSKILVTMLDYMPFSSLGHCASAQTAHHLDQAHCSGSWNDSDTSLDFRHKLLDPALNPDGRYGVVADSAFP
ncbi:hypothetical protein GQ600_19380 [Phytophthora cactorum]|nr:hypothetical protein GQ600_19380 [Phytophthora cactorum]